MEKISLSRCLKSEVAKIINSVIQINRFFGHEENSLFGMMVDNRKKVRKDAFEKILQCRKKEVLELRKFKIPKFRMDLEKSLFKKPEIPTSELFYVLVRLCQTLTQKSN